MKFGEVVLWVVIIIVASLIVSMVLSPSLYTNMKNKVSALFKPPISKQNDTQTKQCLETFNECKDIYEKKYMINANILEIKKSENISDAEKFYNTWKGQSQPALNSIYTPMPSYNHELSYLDFPLVLIAISLQAADGPQPYVLICNKDSNLLPSSKSVMFCG